MYAIYIPGKQPCGVSYVQAPMGAYVGHYSTTITIILLRNLDQMPSS